MMDVPYRVETNDRPTGYGSSTVVEYQIVRTGVGLVATTSRHDYAYKIVDLLNSMAAVYVHKPASQKVTSEVKSASA